MSFSLIFVSVLHTFLCEENEITTKNRNTFVSTWYHCSERKNIFLPPCWQIFPTLNNRQLNLRVKKSVPPLFLIIKVKMNWCVEISYNNLKHFHANFTKNTMKVMGVYFLLRFHPFRLNVHLGTKLSVLILAWFSYRVDALRLFCHYCFISGYFYGGGNNLRPYCQSFFLMVWRHLWEIWKGTLVLA